MFDILLLFAVAWGFFEGFYDEGGSGGFDGDGGLTVLDGEFYGDALLRERVVRWEFCGEKREREGGLRVLSDCSLVDFPDMDGWAWKEENLPSLQWLWRYLHRLSWVIDREDQS